MGVLTSVKAGAAAVALMALAASPAAAQPQKTLKVVVHADLKVLDVTANTTYITNRYGYQVYDTLFAVTSRTLRSA